MSSIKAARGNRKYWYLRDILPSGEKIHRKVDDFQLQDEVWSMYLLSSCCNDLLRVYFMCKGTKSVKKFIVTIGIIGKNGKTIAASKITKISPQDFNKIIFVELSQLESMEDLKFFVEVTRKGATRGRKSKVCTRKHQKYYKELLLSGKNSDLTLKIKRRKFNCHSSVLSLKSPVFAAMMNDEMKEKGHGEVDICDSDPTTFRQFLLYLYSGSEEHLNWKNVMEFYKLGQKYLVEDLKSLCVERMKMNLSKENFLEIFLFLQQYWEWELSDFAYQFFENNRKEIFENENWIPFLKQYPELASILIKTLVADRLAARGNRKYWNLRDVLPTRSDEYRMLDPFRLLDEEWMCGPISFCSEGLNIALHSDTRISEKQYNVRVGIIANFEREIAISVATFIRYCMFEVKGLINCSQLDLLMKSNIVLNFFVELTRENGKKIQEIENCLKKGEKNYIELLLSGRDSDLIIKIKHRIFKCHRFILSSRSPVFAAMLDHDMQEKTTGEICINDSEPLTFYKFLLCLYCGDEYILIWRNAIELYKLGNKYLVESLKLTCVQLMTMNLSMDNFFEIFLLSLAYCDFELYDSVYKFFVNKSSQIMRDEKWVAFLKERPVEANVLIKSLIAE